MSRFTSIWSTITGVADALVTAGTFNHAYKHRTPTQIPGTHRKVILVSVVSEEDLTSQQTGSIPWEGVYRVTVLRHDFGADADADGFDEFIGTLSDPGIGVLTDTVIKEMETNLKASGLCDLRIGRVLYGTRETQPRLAGTFEITVLGVQTSEVRGSGPSGSISVVPQGTELVDLSDVEGTPSDNDVLTWDSASSMWGPEAAQSTVSVLADLDDADDSDRAAGRLLVWDNSAGEWQADQNVTISVDPNGASMNLPMLTADPSGASNGDVWLVDDGGVYLRYKRPDNGQLLEIGFSVA